MDVGGRGARVALGALKKEGVDVRQTHPTPGLARSGHVVEQLADVIELLADRDLRVASMPSKVGRVVAQNGRSRWRAALDRSPRQDWDADDLIDTAQSAHRRSREPEADVRLAREHGISPETRGPILGQLIGFP